MRRSHRAIVSVRSYTGKCRQFCQNSAAAERPWQHFATGSWVTP